MVRQTGAMSTSALSPTQFSSVARLAQPSRIGKYANEASNTGMHTHRSTTRALNTVDSEPEVAPEVVPSPATAAEILKPVTAVNGAFKITTL